MDIYITSYLFDVALDFLSPHSEGLREKHSPLENNVCLKKTFKCQKVQEIRLVRDESVSYLGECERNQSNSELVFIFPHDVIEQNQEVATQ